MRAPEAHFVLFIMRFHPRIGISKIKVKTDHGGAKGDDDDYTRGRSADKCIDKSLDAVASFKY